MRRRDAIGTLIGAALPRLRAGEAAGDELTGPGGFAGTRMRLNIGSRLRTFNVEQYVALVEERKYRGWKWIGEQPGKWLEAAILSSNTFGDTELRNRAASVLARMIAAQEPSGYLGITDPAIRTPQHPLRGMDAYELYFTLHALLTAKEEWRDDGAGNAAAKLGDYFVEHIGPGKAEFWPKEADSTIAGHAGHHALEGTLLIDPMMRLHQATGERKYLDWSKWVVSNIDRWSGCDIYSNLDKVAQGAIGLHQVEPKVHAHTLHMNLMGFVRLYQATGDESYLRRVLGVWRDITAKRIYITGGTGYKEYYRGDYELPNGNEGVETCGVMSWIQLNQMLLGLTRDPAHADAIEKSIWNHAFAAQTWDGDGFRYGVPMSGWKPGMNFTGPNCCSASGPRLLALLPTIVYSRGPAGFYVNQFLDSTKRMGRVLFTQRTNYPAGDRIEITVVPDAPERFAVHVRIPAWCRAPRLSVNGKPVAGNQREVQPGTYAKLERTWGARDQIELTLPMDAVWVKGEHGNTGLRALTRGPMVYVFDSVWQDERLRSKLREEVQGDPISGLPSIQPDRKLTEVRTPDRALGPFYRTGSDAGPVVLSPFANLGRWYPGDTARPSALPDAKSRLYPYGVWLAS